MSEQFLDWYQWYVRTYMNLTLCCCYFTGFDFRRWDMFICFWCHFWSHSDLHYVSLGRRCKWCTLGVSRPNGWSKFLFVAAGELFGLCVDRIHKRKWILNWRCSTDRYKHCLWLLHVATVGINNSLNYLFFFVVLIIGLFACPRDTHASRAASVRVIAVVPGYMFLFFC